jgi:hypothetical protein
MMTDQPATLDRHRRLPAQKATQVRRFLAGIEEQFLRARKEELETQLRRQARNEQRTDDTDMNESINEIERLLREITSHLGAGTKMDTRKAVTKLQRIAALASTSAFTIQARH